MLPVTIFDKHSLRVLLHFARESPPSRPDVLVVILSMLSSAPIPITNVRFQAAVPKVHRPCIVIIYFKPESTVLCRLAGFLMLLSIFVCVDNEGETAATVWNGPASIQPHSPACCDYTSPAAGQPSKGWKKSFKYFYHCCLKVCA